MNPKKMPGVSTIKIIAHRGASYDAPENTVAAAKLGWEQQADGLEMDVYLTADGRLAVIHDQSLLRTARLEGRVEDCTLRELKRLDAGKWKGDAFAGEKIPALEELLETVPSDKLAVVEIKTVQNVVGPLARAFETSNMAGPQVVLICFDYEILRELKRRLPQYEALWLVDSAGEGNAEPMSLEDLIQRCKEAGFDGFDFSKAWPIDCAFVKRVHEAGLKIGVWTVDNAEVALALNDAGVDYLTTNRPGWIRETLIYRSEQR